MRELGEGQFGRVVLVKDQENEEFIALKCICKRQKYFNEVKAFIEVFLSLFKILMFKIIFYLKERKSNFEATQFSLYSSI